jgi:tetraacyldisaccharide 4'-kinase
VNAQVRPRPWLAPLGALYGGLGAVRHALYRKGVLTARRLQGPVVSVGNLAVGGRGKTPTVRLIVEMLQHDGAPVAVLSRGYGGQVGHGFLVVSDGQGQVVDDAERGGDEPVLLARALPKAVIAVGADRAAVGRRVEAQFGRRVHVLDDGFQHFGLHRDLDVLCVVPGDFEDRPLPAGALRELSSAARRADIVMVVSGPDASPGEIRATVRDAVGDRPVVVARRVSDGFADLEGRLAATPASAVLLSGVAAPERFEVDVRRAGVDVRAHRPYADHHRFTGAELDRVFTEARERGASAVVTTEKDAVRLPRSTAELPLLVFRMRLELDDETPLRDRLRLLAARVA